MRPFPEIASRLYVCMHPAWVKSGRSLIVLMIAFAASLPIVRGADIRNTTDRLVMAEQIERTYIDSLGLKGQSGAAAVEKMLAEGFRCRMEGYEEHAPEDGPMWYCTKRPSGMEPPCDELRVALRFGPQAEKEKSRAVLLASLQQIKVASVRASCPGPRSLSVAYLAARSAAEKSLNDSINALHLKASGDVVYGKLLNEGFYCGFVVSGNSQESPRMECTKLPSQIKFCYEAKVTIGMAWPDGVGKFEQLYRALPKSRIMSIQATCEIPSLQPEPKAPA